MTLYLDSFFLLNLVLNHLLLSCSGKLDGTQSPFWRRALASLLGTGYALLCLLPGGGLLSHPVGQGAAAVLMLLVAYGRSQRLPQVGGLFLLLSCALSGGLLLLSLARGRPLGLGAGLGLRGILAAAALGYGALSLLLRREFTHTGLGGQLQELTLFHKGRSLTVWALQDTGNTLRDPLTGRSVVVIEGKKLLTLLPDLPLWDTGDLADPIALLERLAVQPDLSPQLIPYRAVGIDHGLLLALRLDRADYNGRTHTRCLTALSPTPVSDGGSYCALVGE